MPICCDVSDCRSKKNLRIIARWTILKSLIIGILLETILLAPALIAPWGHAGPETLPGLLSFLLNLPGFVVLMKLTSDQGFSTTNRDFLFVFVIQTLIISYFVFVMLRWRKLIKGF